MPKVSAQDALERRNDPLRDFYVLWDEIRQDDVVKLRTALDAAWREEDIQQFLQKNPKYLIQHLGGGHGRWVIPKKKLGAEHITDFMIGHRHSSGYEWQAVELESPLKPMFNKNGDPSQYLNHAIRQIRDWRSWLIQNQNYAARAPNEDGLGLTDVDGELSGLILIGRRSSIQADTTLRRRQIVKESNIDIHTYDYLLESLSGRLKGLSAASLNGRYDARLCEH